MKSEQGWRVLIVLALIACATGCAGQSGRLPECRGKSTAINAAAVVTRGTVDAR